MGVDDKLRGLQDGDTESFEYLVEQYAKRIFGFIYHMVHNSDISEDLTQDVLLKVFENSYRYNPEYPIEPWLFKIAYNVTINYIKKNRKSMKEISIDECLHKENLCGNSMPDFETRYVILKEIQSFSPECRAIFLLRFMEDLTFEQIGETLNKSTASVKLKFYRNREILCEKLKKSLKGGRL